VGKNVYKERRRCRWRGGREGGRGGANGETRVSQFKLNYSHGIVVSCFNRRLQLRHKARAEVR
jgi:hypothetical protein